VYAASRAQPAVRAALERLGGRLAPFAFRAEGVRAERDGVVWAPALEKTA
jgi:hypothetical protein